MLTNRITKPQTASACTLTAMAVLKIIHESGFCHEMIETISGQTQSVFEERKAAILGGFLHQISNAGEHLPANSPEQKIVQKAIDLGITADPQVVMGLSVADAINLLPDLWENAGLNFSNDETIAIPKPISKTYQRRKSREVLTQELIDLIDSLFNPNNPLVDATVEALMTIDINYVLFGVQNEPDGRNMALQNVDFIVESYLQAMRKTSHQHTEDLIQALQTGKQMVMIAEGHTIAVGQKDGIYFSFDSNTGCLTRSKDVNAFVQYQTERLQGEVQVYPIVFKKNELQHTPPQRNKKNESKPKEKIPATATLTDEDIIKQLNQACDDYLVHLNAALAQYPVYSRKEGLVLDKIAELNILKDQLNPKPGKNNKQLIEDFVKRFTLESKPIFKENLDYAVVRFFKMVGHILASVFTGSYYYFHYKKKSLETRHSPKFWKSDLQLQTKTFISELKTQIPGLKKQ